MSNSLMMKYGALGLLLLLGLQWSAMAAENEKRQDYKCYLETNQGFKLMRFSWFESKVNQYLLSLPGTELPRLPRDKPIPLYAKAVLECVKNTESFTLEEAKQAELAPENQG
ncbi:hypothetical protein AYI92_16175 [Shewanella xiamenensis]|uniref:TapY2 family type IVa secretion system protein n=1 Tax=Shewanella xiamenensis TaxID=332186 RepID=UPI0011858D14|nr:TapY2 family type IVa secretion system protein [Shewanella xiamenensis]TVL15581.1 hypothetical protein AYI90_16035 [Shewanella xiamenensis]TVL15687.1 hypothetical protein AYI91_16380 [Shewanella xiamenensis]TVL23376.1 hypothetical protein AYI92_16175 [Shewanella xiamenensis]TVL29795.1 hypothetical protein AYI93_16285 [Shewanella xiamenensis]TVO98609.1 hypothetical protein AYI89_16360 [Shewanella xiamenensis]